MKVPNPPDSGKDTAKAKGVHREMESEGRRRQSSGLTNRNHMFVWTDKHISAHFMVCFTALVMMRLLQLKLGNNILSAERIQRALSSYCCEEISKGIFHINLSALNNDYVIKIDEEGNEYYSTELSDSSETVDDLLKIQSVFGETFDKINVKQEKLNRYLKGLLFAIT